MYFLMLIVVLVLVWAVLAAAILGIAAFRQRLRDTKELRKREELSRWAEQQRKLNLGRDDETWHKNQEMDLR